MRALTADQALDELYATPPEAFTKTRDALAKRLRDDDDATASERVKNARKPTQIAYVLNQLARRHPDDVAALVDVGRELARAQRKALRGGNATGDLREAIARQRQVVGDVTRKTASLMQELGLSPGGHLDEVAGALQAALVDPAVGAELEEGRLEKVPAPAAGFPGAAAVTLVEAPRPSERAAKPKPKATAKKETKAEAARREREARLDAKRREALAKARAAAEEAEAHARELAEKADHAARSATKLRDEADRLAAEAHARAKDADHAEALAKKAAASAKTAAKTAAKLVTRAHAA